MSAHYPNPLHPDDPGHGGNDGIVTEEQIRDADAAFCAALQDAIDAGKETAVRGVKGPDQTDCTLPIRVHGGSFMPTASAISEF